MGRFCSPVCRKLLTRKGKSIYEEKLSKFYVWSTTKAEISPLLVLIIQNPGRNFPEGMSKSWWKMEQIQVSFDSKTCEIHARTKGYLKEHN